jgi:hypothetical protein
MGKLQMPIMKSLPGFVTEDNIVLQILFRASLSPLLRSAKMTAGLPKAIVLNSCPADHEPPITFK